MRRLRGRLAAPVTVWTTGDEHRRSGLTVSSMMVAEGDPAELIGLINSDSELAELLASTRTVAVSVLGWPHRQVADVFAGLAPSPGGLFRTGRWRHTEWGPVLDGAVAWAAGDLINAISSDPEPPASTAASSVSPGAVDGPESSLAEPEATASPGTTGPSQLVPRAGWSLLARVRLAWLDIANSGEDPGSAGLALLRGSYKSLDR